MKKINLDVSCKLNCFGFWNSCKLLQNFVNVADLYIMDLIVQHVHTFFKVYIFLKTEWFQVEILLMKQFDQDLHSFSSTHYESILITKLRL